jgi:hypothetical protein
MLNYLQSGILSGGGCTKENVAINYATGTLMTAWGDSKPLLDTNVGNEFDGNSAQDNFNTAAKTAGATEYAAGKDWGAGNGKAIGQVKFYGNTVNGFGSSGVRTFTYYLEGSNDDSTYTQLATVAILDPGDNTEQTLESGDKVTTYRYVRLRCTFTVLNGTLCEIQFFEWKCP